MIYLNVHAQSNIYIRTAIKYISHNYEKDISIESIAYQVGLDRSYFSKLFKELVGTSPSNYIRYYRMLKAKFLLMHTNYKINEVAFLVGYKNVNQFSKMFKHSEKTTVSEYRKNISKGTVQ